MMESIQPYFYLFVNSGSGGSLGAKIIQQEIEKIQFILTSSILNSNTKCHVYFFNMRKNKDEGFKRLGQDIQDGKKCYAIVCGGDGTVMWIVSELVKNNIRVLSVPIGIIPLGTGNDFSRDLGWGGQKSTLLEQNYKSLKKLIGKWIMAKQEYFDIWDVQAQTYENGKLEKVQNYENSLIEGKTIKKTFCNYFSFGIDGKIGYSFDMHRTSTRMGNLAMYGVLGMVKAATSTKTLDQLLQSIQVYHASQSSSRSPRHSQSRIRQKSDSRVSKMSNQSQMSHQNTRYGLMIARPSSELNKNETSISENREFQRNFYNILALNINSYTGGVKNIWDNAKKSLIKGQKFNQQTEVSTGDGKLEIVAFGSSVGIAMERTFGGFARKVSQSSGPFVFNFKKYSSATKHRTYLQIDGEFIRFTAPKKVTITKSSMVPHGKIKVLRCNEKAEDPFDFVQN